MYLVAFLDWFSRRVVAWELSETLEMPFVLSCTEATLRQAVPEIVDSDQGSHFTSERFTNRILAAGTRVSMDGRGRFVGNIFTERLWRSVKYEEVYLTDHETPREARVGLASYLQFYNQERPHQLLGNLTPAAVYADPSRLLKIRADCSKNDRIAQKFVTTQAREPTEHNTTRSATKERLKSKETILLKKGRFTVLTNGTTIYYTEYNQVIVVLLGGIKKQQQRDIQNAIVL